MLDPITTVTVSGYMAETMFTASFLNVVVVHMLYVDSLFPSNRCFI